jgi:hypothetical protein
LGKRQPDAKRAEFELTAPKRFHQKHGRPRLLFDVAFYFAAAIMNPAIMEDS